MTTHQIGTITPDDIQSEYTGLGKDVEIQKFIIDLVGDKLPDIDVTESTISGEIVMSMEVSNQLDITIHDQKRHIIRSGVLEADKGKLRAADVQLDHITFRLTKIRKQGDDIVLMLEDRRVAWLRAKKGPRKAASRAKVTRAQYIIQLVRSVNQMKRIKIFSPQQNKKQAITKRVSDSEKRRKTSTEERDADRGPGFDDGTKVNGVSKGQLENIEVALGVASEIPGASERVMMAMLVAGFGESNWSKAAANGQQVGVFQSNQIPANELATQARHFLIGGRSFLAGGAVEAAKKHPDWTIGMIASKVEISDAGPAHYDKHRGKAKRVLEAWSGKEVSGGSTEVLLYKRYEFKVEKEENYWEAIQRMAVQEVNWRAFFSGTRFFYVDEEDLFKSRARYSFSEDTVGIHNIDFDWDHRKRAASATVECRIDKWKAPPGTVVVVEDLGPASGRWLVTEIRRNLFSPEATISLVRRIEDRAEPRPESTTRNIGDQSESNGNLGTVTGDTVGIKKDMMKFLERIAGETSEQIVVSSGKRNDPGSNHHSGNAADIDTSGDARSSKSAGNKGDNIAIAVMVVCGMSRAEARKKLVSSLTNFSENLTWEGYSVEMGWRTLEGGNHFNHVHVGFDGVVSSSPGGARRA